MGAANSFEAEEIAAQKSVPETVGGNISGEPGEAAAIGKTAGQYPLKGNQNGK